jgi:hypothetical protein
MLVMTERMRELLAYAGRRGGTVEIGGPAWMRSARRLEREGLCQLRRLKERLAFYECKLTPEGETAAASIQTVEQG